ncbi:MAG: DUF1735 and LamG domain-containing protein [Bacteroidales bacterium]|nr:DUF1735 and LamG domain-containing protein [Bacteroidales bacterium]
MKKSILLICAAAACLTACTLNADKFDYQKEIALITGTDASPLSKDQILADEIPISYNFSVSLTGLADEDVNVHIAYDSLAVQRYNAINKTNYAAVPRNTFVINDEFVTIKKGSATSPMTSVTLRDNRFIEEGVNYVIPLAVAYMDGGKAGILEASKNLFIKIGKTVETFSLDIPGTGVYSTHSLGSGYALGEEWTLEIKAHPYNMKSRGSDQLCRLCCWNEDGGGQVLLRFNENGKPWKTLDIVAPTGRYVTGAIGDPATGTFEQNQWYMISIVWNGSDMSVFINGEKDSPSENSVSGSQAFHLNRFEIGMSWGGYGSSQSYTGRMAEMRIWNIARSQSDIASTLCSVDAKSEGLLGYWKMNEGEGHVFHDSVAGNDMDWDKSERDFQGHDPSQYSPNPNAGAAVQWVKDEKNKCAQ